MRLDRETWERVRDLVEGLRIVGQSSASNLNGLPTPDASPDLGNLPVTEASAARFWDLAPEGGERGSRSTSTMFIQPRGGAGAMPVNRAGELLAYVVHGVGDGREVDLSKLPTQLCALLEEAEKLNDVADGQMEEEEACERALALLS